MQLVSSRIWTRVTVFISYDDNHFCYHFLLPKSFVSFKSSRSFVFMLAPPTFWWNILLLFENVFFFLHVSLYFASVSCTSSFFHRTIGQMSRVFANSSGDRLQSKVESYQRLKKWDLIPLWLALSTIRWGSRVKWSKPGNGVAPSLTTRYSSYWIGTLCVTLN